MEFRPGMLSTVEPAKQQKNQADKPAGEASLAHQVLLDSIDRQRPATINLKVRGKSAQDEVSNAGDRARSVGPMGTILAFSRELWRLNTRGSRERGKEGPIGHFRTFPVLATAKLLR